MGLGERGFENAPFAYVRTPLRGYDAAWRFFSGDWKAQLLGLLREDDTLRLAIHIASPSLSREITAWLETENIGDRAARRALAYVLRACTRTTPFGLFATVARVDSGDSTTLRLRDDVRSKTRPDMGWLRSLADDWKSDPDFRRSLRVRVNDAIVARGERYVVYHPSLVHRTGGEKSRLVYTTVSLKATEPVVFLKNALRGPASLRDVAEMLHERYGEDLDECFRLLDDLWRGGFFIDELQPDPSTDPVSAALSVLSRTDGERAAVLHKLVGLLHDLDETPVAQRAIAEYRRIEEHQASIDPSKEPKLQTDAIRSTNGMLARSVFEDVSALADIMLRWHPLAMKRYRQRFIERYEGTTREVPLLELVHPSLGLGVPEELELDSILSRELIERRFALASQALLDGRSEVVLDEDALDALLPSRRVERLAASFDLGFEILADSAAQVEKGEYYLVGSPITSAPMAGATIGRFAHALGESAHEDLRWLASRVERIHPDAAVAELVVSPAYGRGLNVSIRPVALSYQVRLGLMHEEDAHVVTPDDLVVGLDERGFYVRSLALGKRVEVLQTHMHNTSELAPSLGRFLSLLTHDGTIFPHRFDWGPAQNLTFLPRLRCGRIIVSKARWRFERSVLVRACSAGDWETFERRWRLPRYVQIVDHDNALPLDVSTDIGRQLLADHAAAHAEDVVYLEELLPQPGDVWLQDERGTSYRAEFVASFVQRSPRNRAIPAPCSPTRAQRLRAPGSEWIYFKLYVDGDDQDRFLAGELAPLLRALTESGAMHEWFFVRYADPLEHVRVRMRKSASWDERAQRRLDEHVARWVENGTLAKADVATYEREIERYGGVEGMALCERLFAADSAFVLANLSETGYVEDERRLALAGTALAELADVCAQHARRPAAELIRYERAGKLSEVERRVLRAVKEQLRATSRSIHADMCRYASELLELERGGGLRRPVEDVLDAIMHMHCNRCGLTPAQERRARLIARQALHGASRGVLA